MDNHAKPLRLYLVEDSPIMVSLLRDLLEGDSALEVVGQSAKPGIATTEINALAPDVVIVDIALENGNGFDVVRALPAQGESRPVVMVLSNFATQRYRDEAQRLGADRFFDKNGEIVQLVRTIVAMARGTARLNGSHR